MWISDDVMFCSGVTVYSLIIPSTEDAQISNIIFCSCVTVFSLITMSLPPEDTKYPMSGPAIFAANPYWLSSLADG